MILGSFIGLLDTSPPVIEAMLSLGVSISWSFELRERWLAFVAL